MSESAAVSPDFAATWVELPNPNYAPPKGPYARAWAEMTWDSVRQEIVIYGGNGADSYQNDIWSYSSTTNNWTNLDPQVFCPGNNGFSKPNGTDDTAFKYDPVNNLYWAFGNGSGYRCLSYATTRTAETGSSTTLVIDSTLTGSSPGDYQNWRLRSGSADVEVVAYDPASKALTLGTAISGFGAGSSFQLYASVGGGIWYFDPSTKSWTGQDTPPNKVPTPTGTRVAPAVAWSDKDKVFILFGGKMTGTPDRTVWKLDALTRSWSQLPLPSTAPPHMRELLNSMVYDKANDVFILFGGICANDSSCADNTRNGQTWVYKLSTNTWTNMAPAVAPSPRAQQVMAYDEANGVVVLFGGATDSGIAGDTWIYHYASNTWKQLTAPVSPAARYLAQIAYDPVNARTVIFGGQASTMRADIWALTLTPLPEGNAAPAVQLLSPATGSSFTAPATITLSASASDSDGSVSRVEYYAGTTKIGESSSAPYTVSWSNVTAGTYTVTAVATDNVGARTVSTAATVTVAAANAAPTVSIMAPSNGASVAIPGTLTVQASAADSDGSVAKVEFYDGSTLIGTATASPWQLNWNVSTAGTHVLTAVATDNAGATKTSAAVTVTGTTTNLSPAVALTSPVSGAVLPAPGSLTLTASASDSDGQVAKVDFYVNGSKVGSSTASPYTTVVSGLEVGSYSIVAVATDNLGATSSSTAVNVTVTVAPAVNAALAANGAAAVASSTYSTAYPASAAIDGNRKGSAWGAGGGWNDGSSGSYPDTLEVRFAAARTINRVEVFTLADSFDAEPTPTLTFTKYGIQQFAVQYYDGSQWLTVPGGQISNNNLVWRTISFPSLSTDRIRVVVQSSLASYSRIVEVEAWTGSSSGSNAAPSVAITSPASGSSFTASSSIVLTSTASDSDGSVAKVEYYAGTTKIGEATAAPYTVTWSGVAAGSYVITAVATDNAGAATTSAPVSITVSAPANVPPTVAITSPAGGSTYTAPATITLTASASDADGSVASVAFYAGTTKIGEVTSAPYTLDWTNVPAGSYTLTAVATDNQGATMTAAAVPVVVSAAPGTLVNVAAAANGGVATASSVYSTLYPVAAVNDGSRSGAAWGNGGGWNDKTGGEYPDWVQVSFNGAKLIDRVDVFTLADSFSATPTASLTFTKYGITSFEVQAWVGGAWITVPGGTVTGNNLVWRTISFAPITTDRIRVVVNGSLQTYSRIVEIEAWTSSP